MKAFRDSIAFGETPHADNGFKPLPYRASQLFLTFPARHGAAATPFSGQASYFRSLARYATHSADIALKKLFPK